MTARDGWKEAKAASEYTKWEARMRLDAKGARTIQHYGYTIQDLLSAHPEKDPSEFTTADCEALLLEYPPSGRETRAAHLKSFFDFLYLKRRVISPNPMHFVEVPKATRRRLPNEFSEAEIVALCDLDSPDGPLFVLMFECGLKKGECRSLRRRDINLPRAELVARRSKGNRVVALSEAAREAVSILDTTQGLMRDDYLWYARPGGSKRRLQRRFVSQDGIGDTTFSNWYQRCIEKAGVRYRNPENTRQTYLHRSKRQQTATAPPAGIVVPGRPYANVRLLREVLRACQDFIWWAEPHFAKRMLEPLHDEADQEKVRTIRLLTGPPELENDRSEAKRFATEIEGRGIAFEWRTVETRNRDWHDRYIVTKGKAWNVPPTNTLYKGDYSEFGATKPPPFDTWWDAATLVQLPGEVRAVTRVPATVRQPPVSRSTTRARRPPIPQRVRNEVWRRDDGRCVDCGSQERLEYDHIIPVSKGGSNTARNLQLRCESCNRRKGASI